LQDSNGWNAGVEHLFLVYVHLKGGRCGLPCEKIETGKKRRKKRRKKKGRKKERGKRKRRRKKKKKKKKKK
jgi:hypothetical protein